MKRFVIIGPSTAGKTTSLNRLCVKLEGTRFPYFAFGAISCLETDDVKEFLKAADDEGAKLKVYQELNATLPPSVVIVTSSLKGVWKDAEIVFFLPPFERYELNRAERAKEPDKWQPKHAPKDEYGWYEKQAKGHKRFAALEAALRYVNGEYVRATRRVK